MGKFAHVDHLMRDLRGISASYSILFD